MSEPTICSAKGCQGPATVALRWNNPKLHRPQRRKAWTTCDAHKDHLTEFLESRGFLRQVVPIGDWSQAAEAG